MKLRHVLALVGGLVGCQLAHAQRLDVDERIGAEQSVRGGLAQLVLRSGTGAIDPHPRHGFQ